MSDLALSGKVVAISIGGAPDMAKLGYPQREVDRVLFAICTALVRAGARVLYGGNLIPDGYTFKLFRHLARAYAVRRDPAPFIHLVPEPVWVGSTFADWRSILLESRDIHETLLVSGTRVLGRLIAADEDLMLRPTGGGRLERLGAEAFAALQDARRPDMSVPDAYSNMRVISAAMSDMRVVMGGRMGIMSITEDRYSGHMPGVAEEAIVTLRARRPLIVLGAFGGAARDVAIELGLLSREDRVARGPQAESYDGAMRCVAELKDTIAPDLCDELRQLARLDHADQLAARIVRLLSAPAAGARAQA